MSTIKEVIKSNKCYEKAREDLEKLSKETRIINDSLDFDEVKNTLNYAETKEIYKIILSRNNNKDKCNELKEIMENKKIKEYPEINDVHYYPILKEIEFLNKEQKISLDRRIKEAYRDIKIRETIIGNLDSEILKFLIQNNILQKRYIFRCDCGSFECNEKTITQERYDKLTDYWLKEKLGKTTPEEDKEMHYGCFEIECAHHDNEEVTSLEDFNDMLSEITYKVIQEPDMTLDKI